MHFRISPRILSYDRRREGKYSGSFESSSVYFALASHTPNSKIGVQIWAACNMFGMLDSPLRNCASNVRTADCAALTHIAKAGKGELEAEACFSEDGGCSPLADVGGEINGQ